MAGGAGTGRASPSTKLTTKDVKVEKINEKADVVEFRRWQRTIELQLENVFGKTHVEDLIIGIRHEVPDYTWFLGRVARKAER